MPTEPACAMAPDLEAALVPNPPIISPQSNVLGAITSMRNTPCGCVVLEHRAVVGLFTPQDVVRLVAEECDLTELTVQQVMSQPVITLEAEAYVNLSRTLQHLQDHQIHHLPIVDQSGQFLGLVTRESLSHHLLNSSLDTPQNPQPHPSAQAASNETTWFYQTIANAPFPIMIHAEDGEVLHINDAWTEFSGYRLQDIPTTQAWAEQAYGDRATAVLETSIAKKYKLKKRWNEGDFSITTADGNQHIWHFTSSPLDPLADKRRVAISVAIDVTEARQIEANLRESEERYRSMYEQAQVGIVNATLDGEIINSNRCFRQMLGYSYQELQSKTVLQITYPDDHSLFFSDMEKLCTDQVPYFVQEKRYLHRDGTVIWATVCVSIVRNAQGLPKYTLALIRDTSEQKQAEIELRNLIAGTAATAGQDFFPALVKYVAQALDVPYVLISQLRDQHLHSLAFWSQGTLGENFSFPLAGSVCEQVCQQGSLYLDNCLQSRFPESLQLIEMGVTSYLGIALYDSQGTVQGNLCIFDKVPLKNTAHAEQLLRVFAARAGAELGRQKAMRSLELLNHELETKIEERTATLRLTNEKLLRATKLKDEFLANMSHELRTPLNAVIGMTEGLQEMVFGPLNPRQLQALQLVERSGVHLLALINDILDVAKIEAGQMQLKLEPIVIKSLCLSSVAFVRSQAKQKDIHIHVNVAPALSCLSLDGRRIRQVLINLLDNAVKFTPEAGSITLEAQRLPCAPDCLQISVIDTGIGIAPEDINKLFKPFSQIDSSLNRRFQGTGLGLALVKSIVELHGGKVKVTSKVGEGSCFTCELPYEPIFTGEQIDSNQLEATDESALPPASEAPLILLAEDNEANITMISSYLRAKGYRMVLARNGKQAIELAQSVHPDLILMDIQMPEMDGLEATEQLRESSTLSEVPIIALTALAMEGDRERCLSAGANHYLAKPVRLKQLLSLIQKSIDMT